MTSARFGIAAASVAVVAGGLLTAAIAGASAASATSNSTCASSGKCYAATVTPHGAVAGASQAFTFTVTNEATTQTLGSVQVTAPSGFVVTGAATVTGGTTSYTPDSALFLYLGLSAGQSATLVVDATAPCGSETSAWATEAKQSNQFNGSGNEFVLDPASVPLLAATVTGNCSLAFASGGQPASTVVGQPITSGFDSAGTGITVDILDGNGDPATTSTAAISLTIPPDANPGSGTLSGTTTVDAIGGVATFPAGSPTTSSPGPSIGATGSGYALVATSPGITSATSGYFDIWGELQPCSTAPCSGSQATKTTTGTVSTSSAPSGDYLGVGLGGVSYSCGGSYQPLSDPLSFDVLSSAGGTDSGAQFDATLEIAKSVVQSSGHPGASTWQICYSSQTTFTTLSGAPDGTVTIGGTTYYTGLLPDCSTSQPAPCVQARNKDNAGDLVVTFLASGDPFART